MVARCNIHLDICLKILCLKWSRFGLITVGSNKTLFLCYYVTPIQAKSLQESTRRRFKKRRVEISFTIVRTGSWEGIVQAMHASSPHIPKFKFPFLQPICNVLCKNGTDEKYVHIGCHEYMAEISRRSDSGTMGEDKCIYLGLDSGFHSSWIVCIFWSSNFILHFFFQHEPKHLAVSPPVPPPRHPRR